MTALTKDAYEFTTTITEGSEVAFYKNSFEVKESSVSLFFTHEAVNEYVAGLVETYGSVETYFAEAAEKYSDFICKAENY